MTLRLRRALVVGFGRTGQAVASVLALRQVAVRVAGEPLPPTVDPTAWPQVEWRTGETGPALLDDVDLVVPSPGVACDAPVLRDAVARRIPVWSEIELAAGWLDCPIVAITGTNGKSTTTSLVGLALERSGQRCFVGGNLGTPLIAAVADPPALAVAEISSFQLEWVERFRPRVAAVLNVSADHLDRHGTLEAYGATKARIFDAQTTDDWAVLNRDDPRVWAMRPSLRARTVSFGWTPVREGVFPDGATVHLRLPGAAEERFSLVGSRLTGRHNVENVCAAVAIARLAGASQAAVQDAIETIEPLRHRLALVAERDGVSWWDDSKATNVGATVKSLESFPGAVVLLAGGIDKGGDYGPLVDAARGKVRVALLFGAARDRIAEALERGGIAVTRVDSLPEAVVAAAAAARAGDVVLLAPACSSFDMFTDYAARGRAFCAAVEEVLG